MIRSYSELIRLSSYEDRLAYLKLSGKVGEDTFGFERYLNQRFYTSAEWRRVRNQVIVRDNGMDLGVDGIPIFGKVIIHHMNQLTVEDIENSTDFLLNPEYLICVSNDTHNAIHFGAEPRRDIEPIVRTKNDTCPWRR